MVLEGPRETRGFGQWKEDNSGNKDEVIAEDLSY
jgi:hypothetical protein